MIFFHLLDASVKFSRTGHYIACKTNIVNGRVLSEACYFMFSTSNFVIVTLLPQAEPTPTLLRIFLDFSIS